MQTKATVFLGGGRITGALIAGLRLAGHDGRIVVHDHNSGKLRALRREFRIEAADLKSAVAQADVLIVAVRPLAVADLLNEVARSGIIRKPILAISLAAGIPIKKLRARLEPVAAPFKHLVLATYPDEGPPGYNLSPKAEVTVIVYEHLKVRANSAFREGQFSAENVQQILAEVEKLMAPRKK